jgi:hypothetical protein
MPSKRELIVGDIAADVLTLTAIAEKHKCSIPYVSKIKKETAIVVAAVRAKMAKGDNTPVKDKNGSTIKPNTVKEAADKQLSDARGAMGGLLGKAFDRMGEHLEKDSEPDPVQAAQTRFTIDRFVSSADSKEGIRSVEQLTEFLRELSEDKGAEEIREAEWKEQREEIKRRDQEMLEMEGE